MFQLDLLHFYLSLYRSLYALLNFSNCSLNHPIIDSLMIKEPISFLPSRFFETCNAAMDSKMANVSLRIKFSSMFQCLPLD